jgi:hypothetical protein
MQFPKEDTERLIVLASSNLIPLEPDFEILSEPARSTIVKRPFL